MEMQIATTPFGRRPMSLAMFAAQKESADIPAGKTVDKWQVYRDLCEGKSIIGVSDRALAILSALLSFHPGNELSEEEGLVVFPSNRQLALRAHGMSDTTLRRHLAALVDSGVIVRRDSPNGKRYARKDGAGGFEDAFGLSLAPMLARAEEFAQAAAKVRADAQALRLTREKITLLRRDIGKLIEVAFEEGVRGNWKELWQRFRSVVEAIPRRADVAILTPLLEKLAVIRQDIDKLLELHLNGENMIGNESHIRRHQSTSKTNDHLEFEPASEKSTASTEDNLQPREHEGRYPLGLVMRACPQMEAYAPEGIQSWRDFCTTAAQVRGYLGVSPSAYADALEILGQEGAATVIACLLERSGEITSAGGYLRALTEKARSGQFTIGPMLMAALRSNSAPLKQAG
jgi:replication initiation protein RepC